MSGQEGRVISAVVEAKQNRVLTLKTAVIATRCIYNPELGMNAVKFDKSSCSAINKSIDRIYTNISGMYGGAIGQIVQAVRSQHRRSSHHQKHTDGIESITSLQPRGITV